ncbi:hypothetical protein Golax_010365 [Gossypium laxum]|uniref:Uncharacterized protein n=1 Tax=Gossypium laxum TaxID=34288 RepID=A0A7J8ZH08_9ROSI|nr:hypothetical protein [Gossypium laxum]
MVILVVKEFYASFRDQEMRKRQCESWDTITMRGEEVSITLKEICEFYDIPYYGKDFLNNTDLNTFEDIEMEDVINYLTQGRVSLKWNNQLKAHKGASGNNEEKLDGMIKWMQGIGLVLQEFTQLNGLRAPNYLPNMFDPSQTHQRTKEEDATSEDEDDMDEQDL